MKNFSVVAGLKYSFISAGLLVLAACGGGGGSSGGDTNTADTVTPSTDLGIVISGAGIKGPLAFASVGLYTLDADYESLYNPGRPVASASTDAYAQITNLVVPQNATPPFVLVIDGTDAIDRNTGVAPVIKKLVTIISEEALMSGRPVYATPYTTLAYQMLRLNAYTQNNDDLLSFEAESYLNNISYQDRSWQQVTKNGQSGGFSMQAVGGGSASGEGYSSVSPRLDYPISVNAPGRYYVWVRVIGKDTNSNSLHIGLDHTEGTVSDDLKFPVSSEWSWQGGEGVASMDINDTSAHTLNIWMRESGAVIDKIVITPDANYVPKNIGPPSSIKSGVNALEASLVEFNAKILTAIGFGVAEETNVFSTPPIINNNTVSLEAQNLTVHYRAAIEAFSAMLHELSNVSDPTVSTDRLIRRVALDLYSDDVIDGAANGDKIDGINTARMKTHPSLYVVPNTEYQVKDTSVLMEQEREFISNSTDVVFFKDDIKLSLTAATLDARLEPDSQISYSTGVNPISNTLIATGGLFAAASIDPNAPEIKFYENFDKETVGIYTSANLLNSWNGATTASIDKNNIEVIPDPANSGRGNVMSVLYAGGRYGSGGQWRTPIGPHEELYFSYDIMFGEDFEFVKGGKIPGLMGGPDIHTGGNVPDGTDGWTGRMMWRANGAMVNYMYYVDQPNTIGKDFQWDDGNGGQKYFTPGTWHTVEIRYKMNTPGKSDGVIQAWLDGELAMDRTLRYRTVNNVKVDEILFSTFFGGSDPSWAPSKDQYIYFDNFVVSQKPISH